MISHVVMLGLRPGYDADILADTMAGLGALTGQLPGFTSFEHGPNRDFEQKSPLYPYGFICRFNDRDALRAYANDPRHQMLGSRLVTLCGDDAGNILVYDIES